MTYDRADKITMQPGHTSYFVVMLRTFESGFKAIVDPAVTRSHIVRRVALRSYQIDRIAFIHHIHDGKVDDVGTEIFRDAAAYLKGHREGIAEINAIMGNDNEHDST